jgi:hypothetical protein
MLDNLGLKRLDRWSCVVAIGFPFALQGLRAGILLYEDGKGLHAAQTVLYFVMQSLITPIRRSFAYLDNQS